LIGVAIFVSLFRGKANKTEPDIKRANPID
jgi:hypothetical protein